MAFELTPPPLDFTTNRSDEIDISSDFAQSLASQVFSCQTLPAEMTYKVASPGFAPPEWAFGKRKIWEHRAVQFARYVFVGLANTFTHWLIFFLLYAYVVPSQAICNAVAFIVAVTLGFFLNSKWTFNKTATSSRFFLYTGFMGVLALTFGLISDAIHLNPLVTLVLFSATSLLIGFLYSKFFVFRT